ncbi:unnamed protein product [Schistosoma margrebowiei]|uniref:Uncharacterized protein n=1 Tax=Schistosoma margrebowiei TaxID=48269 RepID=A0AA85AF86_9TREM|nr:unnamed protein product [Schistosoma margrebowiei]
MIEENIYSIRYHKDRIQLIYNENIQSGRVDPQLMYQYIQCTSKRLQIENGADLMRDMNHQESLQIQECFDNKRINYEKNIQLS